MPQTSLPWPWTGPEKGRLVICRTCDLVPLRTVSRPAVEPERVELFSVVKPWLDKLASRDPVIVLTGSEAKNLDWACKYWRAINGAYSRETALWWEVVADLLYVRVVRDRMTGLYQFSGSVEKSRELSYIAHECLDAAKAVRKAVR